MTLDLSHYTINLKGDENFEEEDLDFEDLEEEEEDLDFEDLEEEEEEEKNISFEDTLGLMYASHILFIIESEDSFKRGFNKLTRDQYKIGMKYLMPFDVRLFKRMYTSCYKTQAT